MRTHTWQERVIGFEFILCCGEVTLCGQRILG